MRKPSSRNAGNRKSRRWRKASRRCSKIAIASSLKHASAACWAMLDALMYRFCASFSRSGTAAGGATSQPSRQPVMPKYLEKLFSAFVLNSFSKYFGMTGWRLGWLVAPPAAVPDLEKLAQNLYISASSIAQHAALACFSEEAMAIFEQRREAFRQRRDFLLPALRELGFRIEVEPQGAFYLYADVSAFTGDAQAFCAHFLETEHVAFTPGLDFGFHRANQHVRLAYTQEVPRLQEAVERIARGLKHFR